MQVAPPKGKPAAEAKVDPEVYEWLEKMPDGRLYVMVTLKPLPKDAVSDVQRKAAAKKSQDEFLAEMPPGAFEVGYRYEREPILFGYVKAAGLQNLARNAKVQSVQYRVEPEVHRRLRISSDGFAYAYVVVNSPECHRMLWALSDAENPGQAIDELEREVKRIEDTVLQSLSAKEFKFLSRSKIRPRLLGWVSKEGLEKLVRDPRIRVGWAPDEPPRRQTDGPKGS